MVVEYEAYSLLTKYSSDSSIKAIVDKYDWYFFPVVNVSNLSATIQGQVSNISPA